MATNRREHRLALDWGRLTAVIEAPPRWFIVDTPGAVAVDLGCAYVLDADRNGDGVLRVTEGWVQLEGRAYNPIVPAGAEARTRRGHEPGVRTIRMRVASSSHRWRLSTSGRKTPGRGAAALLAQARPRDSLTLLSLLGRLGEPERALIYPRLAVLLPPPPGVTRDGSLAGIARPSIAGGKRWHSPALARSIRVCGASGGSRCARTS